MLLLKNTIKIRIGESMQTISIRDLQINLAILTKDMKNMDGFL